MPRLNRPLRRTSDADPDDVLGVKFAFHDLGYYDPPTGEFHPWPDAPLFEAIESFQVDNDLEPDGEMLPGGPTELVLNSLPAPGSAPAPNAYERAVAEGRVRPEDAIPDSESWSRSVERRAGQRLTPAFAQVLLPALATAVEAGKVVLPGLLGGVAATAALETARRNAPVSPDASLMEAEGWHRAAPFEALPPQKTEPLRGPSAEEIDRLNKEARRPLIFPVAEPIVVRPEDFPAELPSFPQIYIFPDQSDEIPQSIIIERKGNAKTKAQIDGIRDWLLDRDWKHLHGGRRRHDDGRVEEEEELWIPSPADDFGGDGRKGGRFVDLTMRSPDGKIVHIQTVTLDKHGKPTATELKAADDIRRRTGHHVILVPKTWQLRGAKGGGGK